MDSALSWTDAAWTIGVNWPEGFITFESTGFTQVLRAPVITKAEQCLETNERTPASEAGSGTHR